jgi:hypothetical protein
MHTLRSARRWALILACCAAPATACGDSSDPESRSQPCPTPVAVADTSLLPDRVPLGDWGVVTEVSRRAGFIGAEAVTETEVVVLYPEIVRTMTGNGYTQLGGDNEGFEAEMTFADRKQRLTTFTLREGRCDLVILRTLIQMEAGGEQG